jgi:hypothetical protein
MGTLGLVASFLAAIILTKPLTKTNRNHRLWNIASIER